MSALAVVLMLSAALQLLLAFFLHRALSTLQRARAAIHELIAAVDSLAGARRGEEEEEL
jgi:hypothetical protein